MSPGAAGLLDPRIGPGRTEGGSELGISSLDPMPSADPVLDLNQMLVAMGTRPIGW